MPNPGFYPDPKIPSVLRFWDGEQWTDQVTPLPPATPPRSMFRDVRVIALGVVLGVVCLVVLVNLWTSWTQPSDSECALQRAEVAMGKRASVDSDCEGR